MVSRHSKSITKTKVEFQLNLALQKYILSASAHYTKSYATYLSYGTLGTCVAFKGAEL